MGFYYEIIEVEDNKIKEQKASEMRRARHGHTGTPCINSLILYLIYILYKKKILRIP